jgi:trehalose 6-phosphate synthase/phosphatase
MVEFQSRPHQAVPSEALLEVLDKLEKDSTTEVVIISGRDKDFLQEQFGHYPSFHLSAEYGALWRKPGEAWDQAKGLTDKVKWKENVWGLMDAGEWIPYHSLIFPRTYQRLNVCSGERAQ